MRIGALATWTTITSWVVPQTVGSVFSHQRSKGPAGLAMKPSRSDLQLTCGWFNAMRWIFARTNEGITFPVLHIKTGITLGALT